MKSKADVEKRNAEIMNQAQKGSGPSAIWVNKPSNGQLPVGTHHNTFYSLAQNQDVGYCIYLPPDYQTATDQYYPVIYNLHGAGDNELHGFDDVRVLDDGIRSGRWPPMILVLANGGKRTFYKNSYDGKFMSETVIIDELIGCIDNTYRTISDRSGRCIEGHSMGGRGAIRLAMKFPRLFCSVFNLAGNVPRTLDGYDPASPSIYPNNYLGPNKQNYVENDAYELLIQNADQIRNNLRIQIWCGSQDLSHLTTIRDFHQALIDEKIDHTYLEIEGLGHKKKPILDKYRNIWFDYHVESLSQSGAQNET